MPVRHELHTLQKKVIAMQPGSNNDSMRIFTKTCLTRRAAQITHMMTLPSNTDGIGITIVLKNWLALLWATMVLEVAGMLTHARATLVARRLQIRTVGFKLCLARVADGTW